jgi:hypothetical protein
MVLTTQLVPAGVIFRIVSLSASATYTLVLLSTAMPSGSANRAWPLVLSIIIFYTAPAPPAAGTAKYAPSVGMMLGICSAYSSRWRPSGASAQWSSCRWSKVVREFTRHLEQVRHCGPATINQRLTASRAWAGFVGTNSPEYLDGAASCKPFVSKSIPRIP